MDGDIISCLLLYTLKVACFKPRFNCPASTLHTGSFSALSGWAHHCTRGGQARPKTLRGEMSFWFFLVFNKGVGIPGTFLVTKLFLPGSFMTDYFQTMSKHCPDTVWFGSGTSQDVFGKDSSDFFILSSHPGTAWEAPGRQPGRNNSTHLLQSVSRSS